MDGLSADTIRLALHALDELLPVRHRSELPAALVACVRQAIRCDTVDLAFYLADGDAAQESSAEARPHIVATFVAEAARYPLSGRPSDGLGLPRRRSAATGAEDLPATDEAPYQLGFNVGGFTDAIYIALSRTDRDFTDTEVSIAALLRPRMTATLARTASHPSTSAVTDGVALTVREQEVLALAADGLIDRAIASRLGISERTVQKQLQSIYAKLRAPNRTVAVLRWDRQHGRSEP